MGLKFRRGTNAQKSGSLAFGEPYVNTDLGTLQIGGLTGDITLGASGTGSQGSFAGISGSSLDITGNAKIDGNLTLGGTITIGDNSSDNVVVNADLSSSIIPNNDNSFDLGSTSFRYRAIHGTNIYGAINATNGVVSGSSQVVGILSSLNTYTGSNDTTNTTQNTRLSRIEESTSSLNAFTASQNTKDSTLALYTASVDTKFSTLQTLTASMAAQVSRLQESTASLNAFSASENTKSETLRLYTASIDTKFSTLATYTGSNDTTNTTQNTRLSRIEESTSSLNAYTASNNTTNTLQTTRIDQLAAGTASVNLQTASVTGHITDINTYTSSLKTAFSVSGTDLTVIGNLTVQGDTVTLNVSNLLVEDKVIEIASGSTTSAAANGAGIFISGANASILWDNASSTLDINKSIDVVGNVTLTGTVDGVDVSVQDTLYTNKFSTLQTYTASVDSTLARLRESTASLNAFSASENTKSETLRLYTASVDTKFSTLATYTGSNDTTNTTQNTRLTRLEESTASINLTTSSLATTYEGRATAAKTIFSGSSQVVGSAITTNTITVGSTAITLGGTATTIAGLTSVTSTAFVGALTGNATTVTNGVYTTDTGTVTSTMILDGTIVNGDINASAAIVDTKLATIATAGKVSNSATTAASANTFNAIVARDATGNFTATTITANLTGNASTATTAGTVTTAAQSAITSVGTLTSLTVSGATATGALTVTGAITATGDITAYYTSDKRHKNNIQTIPNALEKVTKLNGVTWEWNDDVNEVTKSTPKTGLIAQEVQEVLPEVVKTRDDGFLALDYSKMMGLMVEAIKEQQTQIHSLTIEIEKLKESKGL